MHFFFKSTFTFHVSCLPFICLFIHLLLCSFTFSFHLTHHESIKSGHACWALIITYQDITAWSHIIKVNGLWLEINVQLKMQPEFISEQLWDYIYIHSFTNKSRKLLPQQYSLLYIFIISLYLLSTLITHWNNKAPETVGHQKCSMVVLL